MSLHTLSYVGFNATDLDDWRQYATAVLGMEAVKQFLANAAYPSNVDLSEYLDVGTKEELESQLQELKKELVKLNTQVATGTTLKSPGQVKKTKKTIARILTQLKTK